MVFFLCMTVFFMCVIMSKLNYKFIPKRIKMGGEQCKKKKNYSYLGKGMNNVKHVFLFVV